VLTRQGRAIESKTGGQELSPRLEKQIAKDVLLRKLDPAVREVEWRFSTHPRTGEIGPGPKLRRRLQKAGIDIVFYLCT